MHLRATRVCVVDRDRDGAALRGGNVAGLLRTWLQVPQFNAGADDGWGAAELGVGPASYPGAAPVTGVQATAAAIDSTNESSAEHSRLMRHMAVNRGMRRPQAVIPLVTP